MTDPRPKFMAALAVAPSDADRTSAEARALAELARHGQALTSQDADAFLAEWVRRHLAQQSQQRAELHRTRVEVLHTVARLLRNAGAFQGVRLDGGPKVRTWHHVHQYEGRCAGPHAEHPHCVEVFNAATGRFLVASLPGKPFELDASRDPE
jgi:hypothetical protein